MTPNLIKIIWFLLPLCGLTSALIGWVETEPPIRWILSILFVLTLSCWFFLTIRFFSFYKQMRSFLRRLLAGDYETGIRASENCTDEISRLENLANQVVDRLRTYDQLRANRVSIHSRALDLLLAQSKKGVITANVEKRVFIFNPTAQKMLGIQRKSFSFESVLKPIINKNFNELFQKAITEQKTNTEGACHLQLPGMQTPARIELLIMPLRNRNEDVQFAFLFIQSSEILLGSGTTASQ